MWSIVKRTRALWLSALFFFVLTFPIYLYDSGRAILAVDSGRLAQRASAEIKKDRPDVAAVLAAEALPENGFKIQLMRKWREEPAAALYQAQSSSLGLRRYAVAFPPDSEGRSYQDRLDVIGFSDNQDAITVAYGPRSEVTYASATLVLVRMGIESGMPSAPVKIAFDVTSKEINAPADLYALDRSAEDLNNAGRTAISVASGDGSFVALLGILPMPAASTEAQSDAGAPSSLSDGTSRLSSRQRRDLDYAISACVYRTASAELVGVARLQSPERDFQAWLGSAQDDVRVAVMTDDELRTARVAIDAGNSCPEAIVAPHMDSVRMEFSEAQSLLRLAAAAGPGGVVKPAFTLGDYSAFKNGARFAVNRALDRFVEVRQSDDGRASLVGHCVAEDGDHRSFDLGVFAGAKNAENDNGAAADQTELAVEPTAAVIAGSGEIIAGASDGVLQLIHSPWGACGESAEAETGGSAWATTIAAGGKTYAIDAVGVDVDSGRIAYAALRYDDYSYVTQIRRRPPGAGEWPVEQVFIHSYRSQPVRYVFSPVGDELMIEFSDRSFEIWNIDTGAVLHRTEPSLKYLDEFGLNGPRWIRANGSVGFITFRREPFVLGRDQFRTRLSEPVRSAVKSDPAPAVEAATAPTPGRGFLLSLTATGDAESEVIIAPHFNELDIYKRGGDVGQHSPVAIDPRDGSITRVFRFGSDAPPNEGVYSVALLDGGAKFGKVLAASGYDVGAFINSGDLSGRIYFWRLGSHDAPFATIRTKEVAFLRAGENGANLLAIEFRGSADIITLDDLISLSREDEHRPDIELVCDGRNAARSGFGLEASYLAEQKAANGSKLNAIFVCADGSAFVADAGAPTPVPIAESPLDEVRDAEKHVESDFDIASGTLAIASGKRLRVVRLRSVEKGGAIAHFDFEFRAASEGSKDSLESIEQVRFARLVRDKRFGIPRLGPQKPEGLYLIDADRTIYFIEWADLTAAVAASDGLAKGASRSRKPRHANPGADAESVEHSSDVADGPPMTRLKSPPFPKSSLRTTREFVLFEDNFQACGPKEQPNKMLLAGNMRQVEFFSADTGAGYYSLPMSSGVDGVRYPAYGLEGRTMAYLPPKKGGPGEARIAIGLTDNEVFFQSVPMRRCKSSGNDLAGLLSWRKTLTKFEREEHEIGAYSDYVTWGWQSSCGLLDGMIRRAEPKGPRAIRVDANTQCKTLSNTVGRLLQRLGENDDKPDDQAPETTGASAEGSGAPGDHGREDGR